MVNKISSAEAASPVSPMAEPKPTGGSADPRRAIALSLLVNAVVPIATFYGLRAAGSTSGWP